MEIRTLLKANIKSKKGSFISTFILTLLIVTIASATLSVRSNMFKAIDDAYTELEIGSVNAMIADRYYTDEMQKAIEEIDGVIKAEAIPSLETDRHFYPGGKSDDNSYFNIKFSDARVKLYNESLDGFEFEIPELSPGEIYLPLGLKVKMECSIGDTIVQEFADGEHSFTIKGFVEEPLVGAQLIGWKRMIISDSDFEAIHLASVPFESEKHSTLFKLVSVFNSYEKTSDLEFARTLNKKTGLIAKSAGSITKAESRNYTSLFTNIITGVMLGFVLILFVIVLVIIAHGIKTEIEIDFENLGILKSQGFSDKTLTAVIALRYLTALLCATAAGVVLSVPLERFLSREFLDTTAILPKCSFAFLQAGLVIAAMLALSLLIIFFMTRKLARISPVKAISGGKGDVYFSSRLTVPVSKKALMPTIAIRSITSDIKKYIGLVFITALLAFFTVTANLMAKSLSSRAALASMGTDLSDIDIRPKDESIFDRIGEIENEVEKYSPIFTRHYYTNIYLSLDGTQIYTHIDKCPEETPALKGRMPKYDNEIALTELAAEQYGYRIGDKVTVAGKHGEAEYLITGLFQSMSDAGMSMIMPVEAAEKLGNVSIVFYGIELSDPSKGKEAVAAINEKFGDIMSAKYYDIEKELKNDTVILSGRAMQIVVYIFSLVFALVSIIMICTKAFAQERTDTGIYKAIGFSTGRLRRQFAVRYFLVSLIGSTTGAAMSALFGTSVMGVIFRLFGVSRVRLASTPLSYIGAIGFICGCVMIFSYIASAKIKKVSARELVTE